MAAPSHTDKGIIEEIEKQTDRAGIPKSSHQLRRDARYAANAVLSNLVRSQVVRRTDLV
jgi:hypothetical protein